MLQFTCLRFVHANRARFAFGECDVERRHDLTHECKAIAATNHNKRVALLIGAYSRAVFLACSLHFVEHLLNGSREFSRARMPQREDLELVTCSDFRRVEALDELFDLSEILIIGRDENR